MKKEIGKPGNIINYDKAIEYCLFAGIFLAPLFFLPFSLEPFEFSKQYIIFALSLLLLFLWLAKIMVGRDRFAFSLTLVDLFVLAYFSVLALSAFFSVDRLSSIFGFYMGGTPSLVSSFSFVIFYFSIRNIFAKNQKGVGKKENIDFSQKAERVFVISFLLVSIITIFSFFGAANLLIGSESAGQYSFMASGPFSPVSKEMEPLSLFLAVGCLVVLLAEVSRAKKEIFKKKNFFGKWGIIYILSFSLGFFLLAVINFSSTWLVFRISLLLFVLFSLVSGKYKEKIGLMAPPLILVVLSLILQKAGGVYGVLQGLGASPDIFSFQREVNLSSQSSWVIALQSLASRPILGSGIGTFFYDFLKFKPCFLNQTIFWQNIFSKSAGHISEVLATTGILGTALYFSLIAVFLAKVFGFLLKREKGTSDQEKVFVSDTPFFTAFIFLLVSQFFYYQNAVLAFFFWVFLALSVSGLPIAVSEGKRSEKVAGIISRYPETKLLVNVFFSLFVVFIVCGFYFILKFCIADFHFSKGVTSENGDHLEKAAFLNPYNDFYRIYLSHFFAADLERALSEEKPDEARVQLDAQKTIFYAARAVELSPNYSRAHEALAKAYKETAVIFSDASDLAILRFNKAAELEECNPLFYGALGELFFRAQKNEEAEEAFEKAISIKSDYIDSRIGLLYVYESKGEISKAIALANGLIEDYGQNTYFSYILGRFYYRQGDDEKASAYLELSLSLDDSYFDSLYALALVRKRQTKTEEAIALLERALAVKPGDEIAQGKLDEIKQEKGEE